MDISLGNTMVRVKTTKEGFRYLRLDQSDNHMLYLLKRDWLSVQMLMIPLNKASLPSCFSIRNDVYRRVVLKKIMDDVYVGIHELNEEGKDLRRDYIILSSMEIKRLQELSDMIDVKLEEEDENY